MPHSHTIRKGLQEFIESPRIRNGIVSLIILNAILLGFETSSNIMSIAGDTILWLDNIILTIFVIEIIVRIGVYRSNFWRDPWSIFDFGVVFIALIPATGSFEILRALRVLRVLRLFTMVPSMQKVVGSLLGAIPGLTSIALVLLIFYYVVAIMATNFFSEAYPEWFGTLGRSLFTLFQIMTLESWSMGIARPVMREFPYAWAFFIPFILIATFTMLNLFIAIIINAMQTYNEKIRNVTENSQFTKEGAEAELRRDIKALRADIKEIKNLVIQNQTIKK